MCRGATRVYQSKQIHRTGSRYVRNIFPEKKEVLNERGGIPR